MAKKPTKISTSTLNIFRVKHQKNSIQLFNERLLFILPENSLKIINYFFYTDFLLTFKGLTQVFSHRIFWSFKDTL